MLTRMAGSLHTHVWPHVICRGVRGMLRPAAADQHLTDALHGPLQAPLESWHAFTVERPARLIKVTAMHHGIDNDRSFAFVFHMSLLHAFHMIRSFSIEVLPRWGDGRCCGSTVDGPSIVMRIPSNEHMQQLATRL